MAGFTRGTSICFGKAGTLHGQSNVYRASKDEMRNGCSIEPGAPPLRGGGDRERVEHEGEAKCEREREREREREWEWDRVEHGGEAKCERWSLW